MVTRKEELQDRSIVRIAAHLPDLIVYGDYSQQRPSVDYFDGVLMFVDISGKCWAPVQWAWAWVRARAGAEPTCRACCCPGCHPGHPHQDTGVASPFPPQLPVMGRASRCPGPTPGTPGASVPTPVSLTRAPVRATEK